MLRFVHTVYWIIGILYIILFCFGVYQYTAAANRINQALSTTSQSSAVTASLGAMRISVYIAFLCSFITLLFFCSYHHDIRVVLKTVGQERSSGSLHAVGKNHLVGRSGWLVWGAGASFLSSLILLASSFSGINFVPNELWENIPKLSPVFWAGLYAGFWLLNFLKYFALRRCAKKFNKFHHA